MTTPPDLAYREIPLTQGQVAIVDTADYEWLSQYKWFAQWNTKTRSFYALRHRPKSKERNVGTIPMHREILGLDPGDPRQGDHADSGQTLDNRRKNLRVSTAEQNQHNRRRNRNNKTGYKGVSIFRKGQWRADIRVNGKTLFLGLHATPELAYEAYCEAAVKYRGEFARFV